MRVRRAWLVLILWRGLRAAWCLGDLWITPAFRGTYASVESCQLLLKHLFGLG